LTVTFLDVGQGDAAVALTPEGGTVLIDAGPEPDRVARDLAALGVRRIDLAVATHAHADHVEGFPAILSRFPVGLLLEPGCPGDSPSHDRFLRAVEDEEVPVRHPRGGQVLSVGRLVIEVLGPDRCSPGGESPNDDSVVVRLSYGEATVLFPGDAEVPAQQDMLEDGDPVTATVLKVPHHGGDTSNPEFFDAVDATVAVVSTGPNDYGHPHPAVLAALRAEGMAVYRTDLLGDVTIRFSEGGLLVDSAVG
jgi:competence protein ComEC